MDSSVVDPELSGAAGRDLRVEHRVVRNIEDVSSFSLATRAVYPRSLAFDYKLRQVNHDVEVPAEEKVGVIEENL